jgi:hypothetical protein
METKAAGFNRPILMMTKTKKKKTSHQIDMGAWQPSELEPNVKFLHTNDASNPSSNVTFSNRSIADRMAGMGLWQLIFFRHGLVVGVYVLDGFEGGYYYL